MALSASTLLQAWEAGRARHPVDRALLLRALEAPTADPDRLADEPLGLRNAALLRLRLATFGSAMRAHTECPRCAEAVEFEVVANELLQAHGRAPGVVEVDGLTFRPPTRRDLAAIVDDSDADDAALRLLERCLVDQAETPERQVLEQLLGSVEDRLQEADPLADFTADVSCTACGHAWSAPFDVAAFLWGEVDATVRRLLDEVHLLAGAYGWSEDTILALSETRRATYVERVLA